MTDLKACLWLAPDIAPKAVELYTTVLPDAKVLSHQHFDNPDMPDHSPDLWELQIGDARLQLMGNPEGEVAGFTDSLSLSLTPETQEDLDTAWDGFLEAGGKEVMCGWIMDPFGVPWQMVPKAYYELTGSEDKAQNQRVVEALWGMVKIDIEGLHTAARG